MSEKNEPTKEEIEEDERMWEEILEWDWDMQQAQEQWGREPKKQ